MLSPLVYFYVFLTLLALKHIKTSERPFCLHSFPQAKLNFGTFTDVVLQRSGLFTSSNMFFLFTCHFSPRLMYIAPFS